jgi:hypothetical protein
MPSLPDLKASESSLKPLLQHFDEPTHDRAPRVGRFASLRLVAQEKRFSSQGKNTSSPVPGRNKDWRS